MSQLIERMHRVLSSLRTASPDVKFALVVIVAVALFGTLLSAYTTGSNAPVARFAMPSILWRTDNPAPGYNVIWQGDFMNIENLHAFTQSEALQGIHKHHQSLFTDKRIFYAFMALPFQSVLGDFYSFRLLNVLLFCATAVILYLFTWRLYGDRLSAVLTAILYTLSMPATATIGSYSAHIGSVFFFCLWAFLMLRLVDEEEPPDTTTVIGLSCVLGLWSLTYGTWTAGALIFAGLLASKRLYFKALIPLAVGVAAGRAQFAVMSAAGFGSAQDAEIQILSTALGWHLKGLASLDTGYFISILEFAFDILFVDNPLIVVLGLIGLVSLRNRARL